MNDAVNKIIDNYRESFAKDQDYLNRQRDLEMMNLENTRRNQFTGIMGAANKAGMMYSNFPERTKYQYDMEEYLPGRVKIQNTYQTGLDKLRSNTVNLVNTLAGLKESISDLNESNKPKGAITINDLGDYKYGSGENSQFRDINGKEIRMGTALKRAGITSQEDILKYAQKYLGEQTYNELKTIWDRQQNTSHPNFFYNVGDSYFEPNYSYLSPEHNALLGRLGLGLN